jgi:flavodoxin I
MTPIGLFYGSNTGFTEIVVKLIEGEFQNVAPNLLTTHDICRRAGYVPARRTTTSSLAAPPGTLANCKMIGIRFMMSWRPSIYQASASLFLAWAINMVIRTAFVTQSAYLAEKFAERGAQVVGRTSAEGYDFSYSRGVQDGQFLGLALDEDNESDHSPQRVMDWVWQLVDEFDLVNFLEPVAVVGPARKFADWTNLQSLIQSRGLSTTAPIPAKCRVG